MTSNADPAGFSGPVDPQGTPGGGSPPGDPLSHPPTLPRELSGDWPDPVHPQAARMPEVREARLKYRKETTYGIDPAKGGVVEWKPMKDGTFGEVIVPRDPGPIDIEPAGDNSCDKGIDTCKEKFDNSGAFGGIIKRMQDKADEIRKILTSRPKVDAPIESIILGHRVVRIRILCPSCGSRTQTEQPYTSLGAGPSHTMHGRTGRLVDIHVGGHCCGDELYAKVPVWLEDDWIH